MKISTINYNNPKQGYLPLFFSDCLDLLDPVLTFDRLMGGIDLNKYLTDMPKISPHVCRHTYCSNQAKAGMNPKTLQYLMGHSEIGVTMNTYTHLGLDDAKNEMIRMEELKQARKEIDKTEGKKPMRQNMFKVI